MQDLSSHSSKPSYSGRSGGNSAISKAPRLMLRSTLRSSKGSPINRRNARDLTWAWVKAKWPSIQISPQDRERREFSCALPGMELAVATSGNGAIWSLTVANSERDGARTWMTRAIVADTDGVDTLDVQTSCTEVGSGPLVLAPPRLLSMWVEKLALEDGGLAVLGEAREVEEPEQLDAFCRHVLCKQRRLPVIALTHSPRSRFYGVDPKGLAEALRGMAHVAFMPPHMADEVAERFGADFGPLAGAARIYGAGFGPDAAAAAHPLIKNPRSPKAATSEDPAAFRRLLCRRIFEMSVSAARDS
ncbi:MAG: hypothetical protein IV107_05775 [Paucibacter sp.]|nr:hypothetical protein [Roseateles sp.]